MKHQDPAQPLDPSTHDDGEHPSERGRLACLLALSAVFIFNLSLLNPDTHPLPVWLACLFSLERMPEIATNPVEGGDGSVSPKAPPYSPITPTFRTATLAPHSTTSGQVSTANLETASLLPVSEADNSDAIALRSAISILQIQRQQSLRDLKTLERQKNVAVANPQEFTRNVMSGGLRTEFAGGLYNQMHSSQHPVAQVQSADEEDQSHMDRVNTARSVTFGVIPNPQTVVRCPPINWAKYHVVGEALDKLHEEQRSRPTPGEPQRDVGPTRPPEHVIAAPYRPWTDKLAETSMRTRSVTKNES